MKKTCLNGHDFEKTSDCPVCPKCEPAAMSTFPKIGAPATRALENADIRGLTDLVNWSQQDLLALHGMGPKAVEILREHLARQGLGFKY